MNQNKKLKKFTRTINWFAFFMAFPVVLIAGRHITMYIFLLIFFTHNYKFLRVNSKLTLLALFFAIGSIVSVANTFNLDGVSITKSLIVLPNYIYWSVIVISLINLKEIIHIEKVSKYISYGLMFLIGFFIIQPYLSDFSRIIFNRVTLNNFSFLLICFAPPALVYIFHYRRNKKLGILIFLICMFFLISNGRRSGTVLVLVPALLALNLPKIDIRRLRNGIISILAVIVLLNTSFTKNTIKSSNTRIYNLIYENNNILSSDVSYLVRRLQIEKALIIFKKNPMTGIGLNNWGDYRVNFTGDFEGSEYVIKKKEMDKKSAHNSYVSLLAEGGLLLIIPFLLIVLLNMRDFIKKYNLRSQIENAYYWSFIAMLIHLYFISAIVNVYCWFLIGIVSMITAKYSKSNLN